MRMFSRCTSLSVTTSSWPRELCHGRSKAMPSVSYTPMVTMTAWTSTPTAPSSCRYSAGLLTPTRSTSPATTSDRTSSCSAGGWVTSRSTRSASATSRTPPARRPTLGLGLWTKSSRGAATGWDALYNNSSGSYDVATGNAALFDNTTGHDNTALGYFALTSNSTGHRNLALGSHAGENLTTGSDNVDLANAGIGGESGTIRIGTP